MSSRPSDWHLARCPVHKAHQSDNCSNIASHSQSLPRISFLLCCRFSHGQWEGTCPYSHHPKSEKCPSLSSTLFSPLFDYLLRVEMSSEVPGTRPTLNKTVKGVKLMCGTILPHYPHLSFSSLAGTTPGPDTLVSPSSQETFIPGNTNP